MYVMCCDAIIVCRRILQQLDAAVIKERPISNLSVYAEVLQHHHNCVKSAKHFKVCMYAPWYRLLRLGWFKYF